MASIRGFSLRRHLEEQGVTDEQATRDILLFAYETSLVHPTLDLTRFKVDPSNPNNLMKG